VADSGTIPSLKHLWNLDPSYVFLNHGSYGAVPKRVLEAQHRLHLHIEEEPVRFFQREYEPLLEKARVRLAEFLELDPEGLIFVSNATTGVNTVLKSFSFSPGDEVIITDHIYNACKNALEYVAERRDITIKMVHIPFPVTSRKVVEDLILRNTTSKTRMVLIDHITSPTALVFPVEELVQHLNERGIHVLVDGAHAPGMVPLKLRELNASFYTGNCHKWLCAPKGSAFLYIREDMRKEVRPLVISHGANSERTDKSFLHLEFDWTGTSDYTPYLLIPDCIDFLGSLYPGGFPDLWARNHGLTLAAREMLCERFGVEPPCPEDMIGSMAALPLLPLGEANKIIDSIRDRVFQEFRIEVPIIPWPSCGKALIRISCQAYNEFKDYVALADALERLGIDARS